MSEVLDTVAELSWMHRNLGAATLEALRNDKGSYVDRLQDVAKRSFRRGLLLSGTTIGGPSAIVPRGAFRGTHEKTLKGHVMYVRNMPTPAGDLVMFPLRIVGLTRDQRPVVDPDSLEGYYSIVHIPRREGAARHRLSNPADLQVDLAFTAGEDNVVTVDGTNPVTAKEFALFEDIVCEFESRVSGISDKDMADASALSGSR